MKTTVMLIGLAGVLALGTACFGLFTRSSPPADSEIEACAGLDGQAKTECEKRHGR